MTILVEEPTQLPISSGSNTSRQLLAIFSEFFALVALLVAVVVVVSIDVRFFENNLAEFSLTELIQCMLILGMALIFAWHSHCDTSSRGFLIAVTTLFTCMFIRENDVYFDLITHGFWVVPAGIIATSGAMGCYLNRASLVAPFLGYFVKRHTTFIHIGFLILIVFSRLFGTGSLWQSVMGQDYNSVFKTVVQEGLELLGYSFMAYGTFMSFAKREGLT
ncbi:hypothetical protein [Roseobacter sp.]|uniref:hypothetical protein n=1 Tax=Roseobacter sp. TaxID=1907202 RepID=UPI003858458B